MAGILLGIIFISFSFPINFESVELQKTVLVDVLPDFIGYLIIWFSLEKAIPLNRWFKECSTIATGMLAITFLGFLGQLSFLLPNTSLGDSDVIQFMLGIVSVIFEKGTPLLTALAMFFLSFLSRGIGLEMENKNSSFLATVFLVFTIIFMILIAVFAVNQFIIYPFELWTITTPIYFLFLLFAGIGMNKIKEIA